MGRFPDTLPPLKLRPPFNRDLIGVLPRMCRSGRTDMSDLEVSLNTLTPVSQTVCAVG